MANKIYTIENIREESIKNNPVWTSKIILASSKWKQYRTRKTITIKLSNGRNLTIENGFEWDLSSVPRLLWSALPPNGDFIISALIHDWLYQNSVYVTKEWFNGNSKAARKFSDKEMFKWAKAINGTRKISLKNIDNKVRFLGVRAFGRKVWSKK